MKMFLVYLKSPTRNIREVEVEVKVCPKTVWAIEKNGTRHLVGSSVFQTMPAAQRCQRALLEQLVAYPWARRNRPHDVELARQMLLH